MYTREIRENVIKIRKNKNSRKFLPAKSAKMLSPFAKIKIRENLYLQNPQECIHRSQNKKSAKISTREICKNVTIIRKNKNPPKFIPSKSAKMQSPFAKM